MHSSSHDARAPFDPTLPAAARLFRDSFLLIEELLPRLFGQGESAETRRGRRGRRPSTMAPKILLRFAATLVLATAVVTQFEQARADDPCADFDLACTEV